ncbi:polysaccharide biosynthesis protein [Zunongwangia endophytica]|uniref:polysaccharide biosynthesis protein n=1 Tax=Zunongwangia endophytica TaxID=1808945 RepID=UPI0025B4C738|nr:polysaccharide biosynthesis protein [Zunongwangia endophytica]MDN3593288.1 polysaccharide biosynthesis protein [Zunongwangia endophytica]
MIHAAAYKHVSLLENETEEAINNNIAGAYILFYLAETYKAEQCILLSTDKAVAPKSVMGKANFGQKDYVFGFRRLERRQLLKTIRFGNVLGSTGSVLPFGRSRLSGKML